MIANWLKQFIDSSSYSWLKITRVKGSFREIGSKFIVASIVARTDVLNVNCESSKRRQNYVLAIVKDWIRLNNFLRAKSFFNLFLNFFDTILHENG